MIFISASFTVSPAFMSMSARKSFLTTSHSFTSSILRSTTTPTFSVDIMKHMGLTVDIASASARRFRIDAFNYIAGPVLLYFGKLLSQQIPGIFVYRLDYHPCSNQNNRHAQAVKKFMQGFLVFRKEDLHAFLANAICDPESLTIPFNFINISFTPCAYKLHLAPMLKG